jgi:redox-sensitive bicupin YhaK (pirin superfamily)
MPSEDIMRNGGRLHGFQIWVNLPSQDKMMPPRYQDTASANIPIAHSDNGAVTVKVIAGESLGHKAIIQTRTPILYLHVTMDPNQTFEQPINKGFNAFSYVIEGKLFSGEHSAEADQLMLFDRKGDSVRFETREQPANFLLLGGEPLNEPVARYGPFVMNTQAEIMQAIDDFNSGRFGDIAS